MKKQLSLKREALTDLSPADLTFVVAGEAPTIALCRTGISNCKICDDFFPTNEGCTPTPQP